jgi:hypothetical protein
MNLGKIFGAVGVFSACVLGSSFAHAAYVCEVYYTPSSTTMGSDGWLMVSLYTAPNCSGSFHATRYYCGGTVTSTLCANSTNFRYNTAKLMGFLTAIQQAAMNDQQVVDVTSSCIGGGSGCGAYLIFRAN